MYRSYSLGLCQKLLAKKSVTLSQQPSCSAVHGLTPLLCGIGSVVCQTMAGAKTRRVLHVGVQYMLCIIETFCFGIYFHPSLITIVGCNLISRYLLCRHRTLPLALPMVNLLSTRPTVCCRPWLCLAIMC